MAESKLGFKLSIIARVSAGRDKVWWRDCVIHTLFLGCFVAINPILSSVAANVTLMWNPSPDPIVAGYDIYFGGASGVYTNAIDAGTNTSLTISNLTVGATYYFASTTYSAAGAVSAFSSEVAYIVPASPVSPPTLNPIGNLTINANAGSQIVSLTGLSSGSAGGNQTLTVTATSSNPNVIPNPAVNYTSTSGSLIINPVANASGSATITVTVNNGGSVISNSFVATVGLVTEQLRRLPGGQMVLTVAGPVGSNYVIQTSTDLAQWTPFSTNTIPPGGSAEIVDLNPNSPQKFYRALPYKASAPPLPQLSGFKYLFHAEEFTLSGPVGSSYVMQSSTNLLNWTPFSTNSIPAGGSVTFEVPNPGSAPIFFRAVSINAAVVPPSPQLSGFKMSAGIVSFLLNGPAGSNYVIQASTDLLHWTPFSTNTISPGGSVQIIDPNPNSSRKFYRAAAYNPADILPPPQLSAFQLGNGTFSFVLNGTAGHTYDIQASQDFVNWTVIGTVTLGVSGSLNFSDTSAANFSRRFYRLHDTQL